MRVLHYITDAELQRGTHYRSEHIFSYFTQVQKTPHTKR